MTALKRHDARGVGPWRMRPSEARTLDALLQHGDDTAAARALGVSPTVVPLRLLSVRERMRLHGAFRADDLTRGTVLRLWSLYRAGRLDESLA